MRWVVYSIFLTFSFPSLAQIRPDKEVENSNWEVYQEKIPVSGGVRVGLMLEEEEDEINPSTFFVKIPNTNIKNLCVELSSKDGRYSAKLNYDISSASEGLQQFYLPTKFYDQLSGYTSSELVILASLADTCTEKPEAYLISGWKSPDIISTFVLYINSTIESTLVVRLQNGTEEEIPFTEVSSPTIAFNKKSTISKDLLDNESAAMLYIKQRVRKMGRVKFNSYEVPLNFK